jgi:hypothetical protein
MPELSQPHLGTGFTTEVGLLQHVRDASDLDRRQTFRRDKSTQAQQNKADRDWN